MNRPIPPRSIHLTLLALLFTVAVPLAGAAKALRPNILFIFADDQCYRTVRALGFNPEVQTPNLDRLAARGTVFSHAYNMGGWHGAVCVASRTMLNTGRFLWNAHKAEPNLKKDWVAKDRFWAQQLAASGYDTYFSGKWHVKANAANVFATARHIRPGMPKQTKTGYDRPKADGSDSRDLSDPKFGGFWEGGKHWSEVLGDDGVEFIGSATHEEEKPFFMYLAFNAPHDPRQSPKSYVDRYPVDSIAIPDDFLPEYPFNEAMQSGRKLRDERLAPFPRTRHSVQVNRREYYAIITHMDAQVGRILDALEDSRMADNTVIVFTADHGLACGHHGLMGKQNLFDHSVRVPFIIAGPDIPKGKTIDTPIYLQDVMPTTLELAGAPIPREVQFKSLLPLIRDGASAASHHGRAIYGAYRNAQRMISRGERKLILYPDAKKALLFDLKNDPLEMHDLLTEKGGRTANLSAAKSLFANLLKLQKSSGDSLDLRAVYPDLL